MTKTPRFSIITVTYNAEETIVPTLKSVYAQTNKDYEYIIIDGHSTDKTLEIVKKYDFPSLKLISEKDSGIYDAMNKGLRIAKGEYVIFLNSGDSFHGNNVLYIVESKIIEFKNPGIVYGQTVIVNKDRKILGPRHLKAPIILDEKSFRNGMVVCHQAFFALKSITTEFDLRYKFSSDFDWCMKAIMKSQKNIYIGDEPIIEYLNEGATTKNRISSLKERYVIMCGYYGVSPTLGRHFKFIIRGIYSWLKSRLR